MWCVAIAEIILLPSIIIIVLHSRQHQSINLTSDPRLRDEDPRVHGNPKKKKYAGFCQDGSVQMIKTKPNSWQA